MLGGEGEGAQKSFGPEFMNSDLQRNSSSPQNATAAPASQTPSHIPPHPQPKTSIKNQKFSTVPAQCPLDSFCPRRSKPQ
jgi:hypothetical protein